MRRTTIMEARAKKEVTRAELQNLLRSGGFFKRSTLHKHFGITDSEEDRPKVWRLTQLLSEMRGTDNVQINFHTTTKEPIYSIL